MPGVVSTGGAGAAVTFDREGAEWIDREIRRTRWEQFCESHLGRNLAVAGALCRSFGMGAFVVDLWYRTGGEVWSPNTDGKPAPGFAP